MIDALREALAASVRAHVGESATIASLDMLAGGASHEAWAVDVERPDAGPLRLVLRRSMRGSFNPHTLDRREEFAVLQGAFRGGVPVPQPLWYDDNLDGRPGFFMQRIDGETVGRRLVSAPEFAGVRARLPQECARAVASIHALDAAALGLRARERGEGTWARVEAEGLRTELDGLGEPHPALELAFAWLREHEPATDRTTVVHGDFRVGNFIVGDDGLRAVLDWEFTHVGNPLEDLGWICVRAWRFGADRLRVGGIGDVAPFLTAYERASGTAVDPREVFYWEVLGNVRWAIGALGQARRHLDGTERSIELASLGRIAAEMEFEVLHLIGARAAGPPRLDAGAAHAGSISDRPSLHELLDAVRGYLTDEVAAQSANRRARFRALIAANVLAIAQREAAAGETPAAAERARLAELGIDAPSVVDGRRAFCAAIRAGRFAEPEGRARALAAERQNVAAKLAIANPKFLERYEPLV